MRLCSKSGSAKSFFVFMLFVAVCFGGYFYWKSVYRNSPLAVAKVTINAAVSGDKETVKTHLTKASSKYFDFVPLSVLVEGIGGSKEFKEGREYKLELASSNGNNAEVRLKLLSPGYDKAFKMLPASIPKSIQNKAKVFIKDTFKEGIPIILLKENGKWKVDGQRLDAVLNEMMSCITDKLLELIKNIPGMGILRILSNEKMPEVRR